MVKDTFEFISPNKTPADFVDVLRRFYGPTMNAFEAAQGNGTEADLHDQLVQLAEEQNTSADGGTSIPATVLRVTISL
jgi:hypothetical protein